MPPERAARSLAAALAKASPDAVGSWPPTRSTASSSVSACSGASRAGRSNAGPARSHDDAQLVASLELGVEQSAVGAEVDEVQEAHVGAQGLAIDPQGGKDVGGVEDRLVVPRARLQQVHGERGEAREAVDLDAPVGGGPP